MSSGISENQQLRNILMFNYILQLNIWLQNAASIIAVANVLLQKFAINKMQCILAIQNFFDKTNGDTINYDSIVLCKTNFIGRDRNMLCQDLFDNCYEKNSYLVYLNRKLFIKGNLCQCHSHKMFKYISMDIYKL